MDIPRVIALPGSIRQNSYSLAILSALKAHMEPAVSIEISSVANIPLYNADMDDAWGPPGVLELRENISQCDAVVIASPEFNHGMPGLLKNALDWLSSPYGSSVLRAKPVLVMTCSPAFTGGVRAFQQLNETLLSIGAFIPPGPQIVVPLVDRKITDNVFSDKKTMDFMTGAMNRMLAAVSVGKPLPADIRERVADY